jgi:uncharacterized protein (TIGR02466 family)
MALDVEVGSGVSLVFATPILMRMMPEAETVNASLRQAILQAEAADKPVQGSSVGGWQSAPNFLEWPVPAIATLKQWIRGAVAQMACLPFNEPTQVEYNADAWANVNRNGSYNQAHNHGQIHWALVYYVDCGRPLSGNAMNGRIELRDPRPVASAGSDFRYPGYTFGRGILIEPQVGLLLAFPGWLEHLVHPFFGEGERISIAINVTVRKVGEVEPR